MEKYFKKTYKRKHVLITVVLILVVIVTYIYNNETKNVIINGRRLKKSDKVIITISGNIKNEGEYALKQGSKVKDVLNISGGLLKGTDINKIDLERILINGDRIIVPKKEIEEEVEDLEDQKIKKININTATISELDTLPLIGEKTAIKIIEYRENKRFIKIDDIKNVSGIGDGKFLKISSYITI